MDGECGGIEGVSAVFFVNTWSSGSRKLVAKFGASGPGFCVRAGARILAGVLRILGWLWGFWQLGGEVFGEEFFGAGSDEVVEEVGFEGGFVRVREV